MKVICQLDGLFFLLLGSTFPHQVLLLSPELLIFYLVNTKRPKCLGFLVFQHIYNSACEAVSKISAAVLQDWE